MKPTIALTDYNILRNMNNYPGFTQYGKEASLLQAELDKAIVLEDHYLGEEIVRLNSEVEIQNVETGKVSKFTIVLPSQAYLKEGKVSVLASMSIALLGFKQGDNFEWQLPGGKTNILILRVKNKLVIDHTERG